MSNKPLSNLGLREQDLTGDDLMLISQLTAAGWKSAQVTLEDFFVEMFKPTNSAGQLIQNIQNELNTLENRFDLHENPALNTTDPNYDPHGGFYLRQVTKQASNSGLTGNGRTTDPLGLDYDYLNQVYARYDQVVNNLTSTSATIPLSANMGRALNVAKSEISDVRKNFGGNIVTIVATTGYNMNNAMPGDYVYVEKGVATVANAPPFQYSTTFTECSYMGVGARFQVARDYITGQFAVRALQNNTWSAWRKNYMEGDIGSNTVVGAADKLNTARRINNVLFDGTQDITINADLPYNGSISNQSQEDAASTPGYYSYAAGNSIAGMGGELHAILIVNKVDANQGTIVQTRHTFAGIKYGVDEIATKIARRVWSAGWSPWEGIQLSSAAASTSSFGVTKLNNTLNSATQAEALTAAMGKHLQDNKANASMVRWLYGQPAYDLIAPNGYNWNNIQPGDYIACNKYTSPSQTNAPPFAYCSVYCERTQHSDDSKIAIAREALTGKQAYRAKANNSWSGWITMMTNSDVENAINNHKAEANPHPQYITAAQLEASAVGGLTEHILDLSGAGFDQNTYYPITINIWNYGRCNFEIDTPLNFSTAPWATHGSSSFSVIAKWSEYASGWGAQPIERTIDAFGSAWSANSPILNIAQMGNSSNVVFWARGKAKYRLKMTKGLVPVIRSSAYSANNETVSPMAYNNALVPVSIQDRKLDTSHLNEANPHPQYALSTAVNGLYPRAGGEITGNVQIGGSGGARNLSVTGQTFLASAVVTGDLSVLSFLRLYNPIIIDQGNNRTTISHDESGFGSVSRTKFSTDNQRFFFDKDVYFGSFKKGTDGYTTLPNGLIMQWGRHVLSSNPGEGNGIITFPIAFPNGCLNVSATRETASPSGDNSDGGLCVFNFNTNSASIHYNTYYGNASGSLRGCYWMAIGY